MAITNVDAARANWRAELHEWAAAVASQAGDTATANECSVNAIAQREYALALLDLEAAKASGDPATLHSVKLKLNALRKASRSGGAPTSSVLNNFQEPSNAELTGA